MSNKHLRVGYVPHCTRDGVADMATWTLTWCSHCQERAPAGGIGGV